MNVNVGDYVETSLVGSIVKVTRLSDQVMLGILVYSNDISVFKRNIGIEYTWSNPNEKPDVWKKLHGYNTPLWKVLNES